MAEQGNYIGRDWVVEFIFPIFFNTTNKFRQITDNFFLIIISLKKVLVCAVMIKKLWHINFDIHIFFIREGVYM